MKHSLRFLLTLCIAAIVFASCGREKDIVLLNDVVVPGKYPAPQKKEFTLKRGDQLIIRISHHDPSMMRMFNQITSDGNEGQGGQVAYDVKPNGYVHLPLLDSVYVVGKTCSELSQSMSQRLEDAGIAIGATVNVKLAGFKVTVIGETATGVYEFEDNGATIFDLMAKANLQGGMTDNTRRDKILVMREVDSTWVTQYISLLSTDIFNSPYFYLQQNDVFYVYPSKTTIWKSNTKFDFWWSRLSLLTSMVGIATTLMLYKAYTK